MNNVTLNLIRGKLKVIPDTYANEILEFLSYLDFKRFNEDLGRISVEQYNKELQEAEDEINNGDFLTQEQVKTIFNL